MIIEFELQGSKCLHKGIFDTHGFWVKYDEEGEHGLDEAGNPVWRCDGYKIFSHCSFAFYHTEKAISDLVWARLLSVLRGSNSVDIEGVGFFRRLNK
jgi:hypothetical protein